jgi:DNA replication regulator DPB11
MSRLDYMLADPHEADYLQRDQIVKFTNGHNARIMATPKALSQCESGELEDGYLVLPHHLALEDLPPLPPQAEGLQRATEWWLERCLVAKRLIDPSSDPFCRPLANLMVQGFEGIGINGTGFTGADLVHMKKLTNLLGATYEEYFLPTTSVLVCNSTREDKLEFASNNSIPAVSPSWIWKCVEKGKIQPLGPYLLNKIDASAADKKLLKKNASSAGSSHTSMSHSSKAGGESNASRGPTPKDPPRHSKKPAQAVEPGAEDSMLFDGPAIPQPALHELPHTNSPKKSSYPAIADAASGHTFDLDENQPNKTTATARELSHPPTAAPHPDASSARSENLRSEIDALRAQFASRPTSAGSTHAPHAEPRIARRARSNKLGRATSGGRATSNPSLSRAASEGVSPAAGDDADSREDADVAMGLADEEPVASQAIVYEDPEVKQRREDMIRRMGGFVEERTVEVERVGSAKDFTGAESGIAGRVAGGSRRKR